MSRLLRFTPVAVMAVTLMVTSMAVYGAEADPHAEEHETPGLLSVDLGAAVWTIVLFVVLLAVLSKFAWPPILHGLQDRERKIRGDLEQAEQAAKEATEKLKQTQAQLAGAQEQAQKIIDEARSQAQQAASELKAQAQRDIDQMNERARQSIDTAKQQAINELYDQTALLATQVAARILRRELNVEDQQQLVDESLQQLRQSRN